MLGRAPNLLPARMINEYVYCPRLFYLEWVQGDFAPNEHTEQGAYVHRRVDTETGSVPPPEELDRIHASSVTVASEAEGIIARIDLVEGECGDVSPVDYKKGRGPGLDRLGWDADRVQVAAQALALRAEGYRCTSAVLYYAGTKTRVTVPIDDALVEATRTAVAAARRTAEEGHIPPPLVDSPKCPGCSLVGICLPDETNYLSGRMRDKRPDHVRRLVAARDDALPVYVQLPYGKVGVRGDRLVATKDREEVASVRLLDVAHLVVFGRISLSPSVIETLAARGATITHFSYGAWFHAVTTGMSHKNVELRLAQFRAAVDTQRAVSIARRLVAGKLRNQRTLLRRNLGSETGGALSELTRLVMATARSNDIGRLLGLEGAAARVYFSYFRTLLTRRTGAKLDFDFEGRNRRPPRDPINALLSLGYALLVKDVTLALLAVGFDPYLGFYHQPRYGRPALALDVMEEFRPLVVDSVVLSVVNTGEVTEPDFVQRAGAVALTSDGRRKFIAAYERRMSSLIRHPVFGYTISYRRVIEVQCRLLGRVLLGEIPAYRPFTTR